MTVPESYQDSIEDILPQLPVKSLVRFKCVSRSWWSLISSPLFTKTHLKRASQDPKLSAQRILLATSTRLRSLDPEKSISSSNGNADVVFDYKLKINKGQARIVGSCNGLVCLALSDKFISARYGVQCLSLTNENDLVLWNPSTRERKRLPNPCTPDVRDIHGFGFGFGYDSSSDDYKVVLIYSAWTAMISSMSMSIVKVSIFSLKENSWRIFGGEVDDFRAGVKRATFLNGALHWRFASHIYGFDLAKETFFKIQFPASCVPRFDKGLGVLNGCLCFLKAPDYDPEIWVMEEYGNPQSWTKLLLRAFDCLDIIRRCHFPDGLYNYHAHFPVSHALLCISKDDDGGFVLVDDARELLRFDAGGTLLERFVICSDPTEKREAVVYTESLVSPNNTHD